MSTPSNVVSYEVTPPKVWDLKSLIAETFPSDPIMLQIAQCESGMRQFDGSKVLVSKTHDHGVFQINEIWMSQAKKLGLDIDKTEDNVKMAKVIKDIQGVKAWTCYRIVTSSTLGYVVATR